jgi:hypothetical protein
MKVVMSPLAHVLIYDSDTRGRETLVYGFEGDGVKAAAAAATAELPTLIAGHRPQIVVFTLRGDSRAAVAFVKSMAETEETRSIPRLVLGPAEALPEELRVLPGGTSFLALPAFVRDVITVCKLLVCGSPRTGENGQSELSGALSDYGLHFIVRTMVGLARSGIVQVERGNRKGELRFSEGDLVSAQVGPLQGHAALHQLLLWEDATLEIRFRPVARLGQSLPSGEELLEDTERFLRDFASATKNIGHAQSLFVQDAERVARLLDSIPAEVVPVMRLFDGQRSLGDVLEDSPFRVFDTLRTITRLLDMGIIRRKAIERPTTGFGYVRRARGDELIRPGLASASPAITPAPAPPTAAATAASEVAEPANEQRIGGLFSRQRAPRRRTGEMPIHPREEPTLPGKMETSTDTKSGTTTDSIPGTTMKVAKPPSVAVAAPPQRPKEAPPTSLTSVVHGELRIPSRNQRVNVSLVQVPKVVIDFEAVDVPRNSTGPTSSAASAAVVSLAEPDPGEAPTPPPEIPSIGRREAGDLPPVESVFARESGVYPSESAENIEDLDPKTGVPRPR